MAPCTLWDGKHSNLISRICFQSHTQTQQYTHTHVRRIKDNSDRQGQVTYEFSHVPINCNQALSLSPPSPLIPRSPVPAISPSSHVGDGPHHWAPHPHPTGAALGGPPRPCGPPLPLFHTRHAEQSAGRPRLVTVARPCGQSDLRKVERSPPHVSCPLVSSPVWLLLLL